jgi:hypothetical protein
MVGGTVADLFHAKHRGLAMNVFACLNFIGGVRPTLICPRRGYSANNQRLWVVYRRDGWA